MSEVHFTELPAAALPVNLQKVEEMKTLARELVLLRTEGRLLERVAPFRSAARFVATSCTARAVHIDYANSRPVN